VYSSPTNYVLPKIFHDYELILLDSEESKIDEWIRITHQHGGSSGSESGKDSGAGEDQSEGGIESETTPVHSMPL
jgi:hypothetical protein